MKKCAKCHSKMEETTGIGTVIIESFYGYLSLEILFWMIFGFFLSWGLWGKQLAFILGSIAALSVFLMIINKPQIYKCSMCNKRYKVNKNNMEEIE